MKIILTHTANQPIYEQIFQQIKAQILCGALGEGDALPSMRVLARELRISVITTKRAYEELERAGLIVSYTGKGSFVAGANAEMIREEHLRQMEEHLRKAVELSRGCAIPLEEMTDLLSMLYKEEDR